MYALEVSVLVFEAFIIETRLRICTPMNELQITLNVIAIRKFKKVGKHFCFTIANNHFSYQCDETSIRAEARLDGISVIHISEPMLFSVHDISVPAIVLPMSITAEARPVGISVICAGGSASFFADKTVCHYEALADVDQC